MVNQKHPSLEAGFFPAQLGPLRRPDGARPRVLFAEDSENARVLTTALLTWMGCDVDAVEDGEQALNQAGRSAYDLILLDIEMPIMDGLVAARSIRALGGAAASTPLMALSAFLADTSKCARWHEIFDLALAKPAGRDELRRAVARMLDQERRAA
jgi:CheY-like chemotaxis protein